MNFKKFKFSQDSAKNSNCEILKDAVGVYINDDNLKPNWIKIPAQFSEFHIKRNKENLLVVVGESWTYGEAVKGIATGIEKYDFDSQLKYCVGPKMAVTLNSDLYQYAVPGNCNFYMFTELERILEYVSTLGYKQIYVCLQMTEPAREQTLFDEIREAKHRLQYLLKNDIRMSFRDWLIKYDDIFFDQYESIISKYDNLNCILWRNFCKVNTANIHRKFKIIDTTWIEYSSKVLSEELKSPSFFSIGWLASITKTYSHVIFDQSELLGELDIIEKSINFIKSNSLHNNHPNEYAHLLWSQFLLRTAGWKNDI